jgi:hypothetical protein
MVLDRGCDDEAIPTGVLRLLLNGQGLVDGACLNRYGVKSQLISRRVLSDRS